MPRVSVNAQLADRAAEHAIDLLRFDATARRQVLGYLRRLEDVLVAQVARFRVGVGDLSLRRQRAEHLLVQVRESIATGYGYAADAADQMLIDFGRVEARAAMAGAVEFAIAAEIELNVLTGGQLRRIVDATLIEGAPSRLWWERQAGDLMQRFSDEIREGVGLAETNDDLVRRIRGRATGRRHRYELNGREHTFVEFKGGLMDVGTRNARALVRTSVQAIAGQVRRDTFEENQDVVKGVVQISTLDLRTTVECIARAGKAWSLPDYAPIDHEISYNGGVPAHWGCRSTEAPLLRSWQELGIDLKEVAGDEKRWSRLDGDVPADFGMDEFLDRRTPEQVDDMLGAGVGKLYRDGAITLDDLVDRQSGRALSLQEIEARLDILPDMAQGGRIAAAVSENVEAHLNDRIARATGDDPDPELTERLRSLAGVDLSAAEARAVSTYIERDAFTVNKALNRGLEPTAADADVIANLDSAISRAAASESLTVYRRGTLGEWRGAIDGTWDEAKEHAIGDVIAHPGFVSTSARQGSGYVGRSYAIEIDQGRPALPSVTSRTGFDPQHEVILGRGSRYEVIGRDGDSYRLRLL